MKKFFLMLEDLMVSITFAEAGMIESACADDRIENLAKIQTRTI